MGEDGGHPRSALDFAIDALETIGRAQPRSVRRRESQHGEALWQVFLGPRGSFRRLSAPLLQGLVQQALCLTLIRCVEDGADTRRHWLTLIEARHIGLGMLL